MSDIYFSATREFDGEWNGGFVCEEDVHGNLRALVWHYFPNLTQSITSPKKMRMVLRLETVRDDETDKVNDCDELLAGWVTRWERLRELIQDNAQYIEDEALSIMEM